MRTNQRQHRDRIMKKICIQFFSVYLLLPGYVFAASIAGVEIPQHIQQKVTQHELVLNGAGIRSKFIFDIYVGALYLTKRIHNAEQILSDSSAKRISLYFLYDKIEKEKMINGWNEAFEDNLSDTQFASLKPEINSFNAAFGVTVKDDMVIIDFLEDGTTTVTINQIKKASIKNKNFQRALLSIWLGASPADEDLKEAMLGKPVD
jgi:hypothetical protein